MADFGEVGYQQREGDRHDGEVRRDHRRLPRRVVAVFVLARGDDHAHRAVTQPGSGGIHRRTPGQAEHLAKEAMQQGAHEFHAAEIGEQRQQEGGKEKEGHQRGNHVEQHDLAGIFADHEFRADAKQRHQREYRTHHAQQRIADAHVEQLIEQPRRVGHATGQAYPDRQYGRHAEHHAGDRTEPALQKRRERVRQNGQPDGDLAVVDDRRQKCQYAEQRRNGKAQKGTVIKTAAPAGVGGGGIGVGHGSFRGRSWNRGRKGRMSRRPLTSASECRCIARALALARAYRLACSERIAGEPPVIKLSF